jgi:hypothetical protein
VAPTFPRYSNEEFAKRGDEIYEREVLPRLTSEGEGKYALIDIETGDYEIDRDELAASDRLFARRPDAQIWFRQVGSRYARRFGPRFKATAARRAVRNTSEDLHRALFQVLLRASFGRPLAEPALALR